MRATVRANFGDGNETLHQPTTTTTTTHVQTMGLVRTPAPGFLPGEEVNNSDIDTNVGELNSYFQFAVVFACPIEWSHCGIVLKKFLQRQPNFCNVSKLVCKLDYRKTQ